MDSNKTMDMTQQSAQIPQQSMVDTAAASVQAQTQVQMQAQTPGPQVVHTYTTITSDKSKKTAFFLCLFGGFLGLHQFYVGKILTGILYLCTFGLCCIGWAIDLIRILVGGFKDNSGQPLRK